MTPARTLRAGLLGILATCTALQIALAVSLVPLRDPDIFGVEPNVIYAIQRLVTGGPLYTAPAQPPFSIVQYPPLYYVVAAEASKWLQIDAREDVWRLYAVARSLSLTACLATAILLYVLCVSGLRTRPFLGLVVAGLSVIIPIAHGVAARPDSLTRLFMVGALLSYIARGSGEGRVRQHALLGVSVALVVLAVCTKQTALVMLPLLILLSALRRRWTELALIPLLALVLGSIALYAFAGYVPSLPLLYDNTVTGTRCAVSFTWMSRTLGTFLVTHGLLLSLFGVTACTQLPRRARGAADVASLYVAGAVLVAVFFASTLRHGVAINHAYDAIIVMIVAVAAFLSRQTDPTIESKHWGRIGVGTLALYIAVSSLTQTGQTLYEHRAAWWKQERDQADISTQEQVVAALKAKLDSRPGSRFFALWLPYVNNRLFDRAVMPQLEIVRYCTYPGRMFAYDAFVSETTGGSITLIAKRSRHHYSTFAGASLEHFRPVEEIGDYVILRRQD